MSFNPYAPSQVDDVAEAPRSQGWDFSEDFLWVDRDATLPMVDPYSGVSEERMTMLRLSVYRRRLWPRFLFVGGFAAAILMAMAGLQGPVQDACILAGFAGFIAGLITPVFNPRVWIHVFVTRRTVVAQRIWVWANLLAILLFFVALFLGSSGPLAGALVLLLLLALLGIRWFRRRIFYRRRAGDRFEIGGLHPEAMAVLRKEASSGQSN